MDGTWLTFRNCGDMSVQMHAERQRMCHILSQLTVKLPATPHPSQTTNNSNSEIFYFYHIFYFDPFPASRMLTDISCSREEKTGCKTDLSNVTKCYCSQDYCNSASYPVKSIAIISMSVAILVLI